jgi:GDPmannose 4,6-dehydratase
LGNIEAKRDIGHAKEYVEGMWRMLQQETPEDFVLSTGLSYSIREIVNITCELLNITIKWDGEGINETATNTESGKVIVKIDPKYFRPAEVDILIGSSNKAKNLLGWEPKIDLCTIIKEMVNEQIKK